MLIGGVSFMLLLDRVRNAAHTLTKVMTHWRCEFCLNCMITLQIYILNKYLKSGNIYCNVTT